MAAISVTRTTSRARFLSMAYVLHPHGTECQRKD
jgi:hypothetical protein